MPKPETREIARLRARLERCSEEIRSHVGALEGDDGCDGLYAQRNDLYARLLALGVRKVELAVWAGSSADAVAKALVKLAEQKAS